MNIQDSTEKLLRDAAKIAKDGRAKTSPVNGAKGGRDFLPVQEWAESFIRARYTRNGFVTLRRLAGQWYEFRGNHWCDCSDGDIESKVVGYLQEYHSDDCRMSSALIRDVMKNLVSDKLCSLDSHDYRIPCFLSTGEPAKAWLPMKNAVINVEEAARAVANGTPLPPTACRDITPDAFFSYGLDYDFDPAATCPKWEKYLEGVQPEPENREMLQMLAGLGLVPDCSYCVAFFLLGEAGTGKSVFLTTLANIIGKENYCSIPLARLADRFGLVPLTQKLLNLVGEMPVSPENKRISDVETVFKTIASGDAIQVEAKHKDSYTARPIARMVFATNAMPDFTDRTNGVWDRIRIIPFNQIFRNTSAQNPHLLDELREELPGIFNWALRGLAKLRRQGKVFPESREGERLKNELRSLCDHERTFLAETTEAEPESFVGRDDLYSKYKDWMYVNSYRPLGKGKFNQRVNAIYPSATEKRRRTEQGNIYCFNGIRFRSDL